VAVLAATSHASETVWLHTLDFSGTLEDWGKAPVAPGERNGPVRIANRRCEHGMVVQAHSALWFELDGGVQSFTAVVGAMGPAQGPACVLKFSILADERRLWQSEPVRVGDPPIPVTLTLHGAKHACLLVEDVSDVPAFIHKVRGVWADARFLVESKPPAVIAAPPEEELILTPKPGPAPRINGPLRYGARPGRPFLYRIPTTGRRPIRFAAEGLPPSLQLDTERGIISGRTPPAGEHRLTLRAMNEQGDSSRRLTIVAGDALALTPHMGWNHWYAHYGRVTDAMVRQAADILVASGMADAGYDHVCIDDCWMNASPEARANKDPRRVGPFREASGNLLPNVHFPDMKALTGYIHSKGLKAGIYTSPGPLTCAGFAGSYQHEAQDARQFASWEFDFLKYDWCSYGKLLGGPPDREAVQRPFRLMGDLLKAQDRDILFNIAVAVVSPDMGESWEWGAEVGAHSWRTGSDVGYWQHRLFEVARENVAHRAHSKPGGWNDPDYLQIGYVGPPAGRGELQRSRLSPRERYSYMSLWCLMAAPLFYSGDLTRLDEFTLNVLCNPEVIEIDQDPLGQCARLVPINEETFLMVKDLADGSKALGLSNRGELPVTIRATWAQIGIRGKHIVRDVWRQRDLGTFDEEFSSPVGRRGVFLVRLRAARG
jgi:alpha-galactosidase